MIGNMLYAQKVALEFFRKICFIIFGVFKSSFFLLPTISGVSQFEYDFYFKANHSLFQTYLILLRFCYEVGRATGASI
jgi:hypothetical protein